MSDPYPPSHPAQPPPGPPGPGDQTGIALTTRYHWFVFLFALIKPRIFLNGHPLPGTWGRQVFPVQPGQHHLHVHVPYFLPPRIGPADLPVQVQPGELVEVEYRAPLWSFSGGSLGPPPQKYNGLVPVLSITIALAVIVLCCCAGTLLASAMD